MSGNATFSDLNDFLKSVDKLGASMGTGALARPEFMVKLATAAQEGTVTVDDAEKVWDRFNNACQKAGGHYGAVQQQHRPHVPCLRNSHDHSRG